MGRAFKFNPKGKYIQLANQMRQENQLEALKQRIAESARKAGLDSEFETLEKNIKVCAPLAVPMFNSLRDSVNLRQRSNGGMPRSFPTRLMKISVWDSISLAFTMKILL